jgi:hypothetical protein
VRSISCIEAAQAYLDRWETHWADTRIHGTTKRQVAVMFAGERPALGPLPVKPVSLLPVWRPHRSSQWLVEVEGAYYGAPPGWRGLEQLGPADEVSRDRVCRRSDWTIRKMMITMSDRG